MSFEDLEAEGLLKLVQCCREFPKGQIYFTRYFKHAWYTRIKELHRNAIRAKRQGIEVPILEAYHIPAQQKNPTFLEMMRERFHEISPLLSSDAKRLLQQLLDPSQEVYHIAYVDFLRKNKIRSQGQPVLGANKFRIRQKHIRLALRMSSARLREVVAEVKMVNRQLKSNWRKE
jgi:hypothetical protein